MTKAETAHPPPRRPGRLDRLGDVRQEMATVYRDARTGRITTKEGSRLIYMLDRLARVIEGGELERRMDDVERRLELRGDA